LLTPFKIFKAFEIDFASLISSSDSLRRGRKPLLAMTVACAFESLTLSGTFQIQLKMAVAML
jgi:hypothetical protein